MSSYTSNIQLSGRTVINLISFCLRASTSKLAEEGFMNFFTQVSLLFLPALVKAVDKTVCIELLNESRVDKNFRLDRFDPRILFDQSIQNGLDAFEAGILFAWKHIFCNSPVIRF